jgi:hypothetical protein
MSRRARAFGWYPFTQSSGCLQCAILFACLFLACRGLAGERKVMDMMPCVCRCPLRVVGAPRKVDLQWKKAKKILVGFLVEKVDSLRSDVKIFPAARTGCSLGRFLKFGTPLYRILRRVVTVTVSTNRVKFARVRQVFCVSWPCVA